MSVPCWRYHYDADRPVEKWKNLLFERAGILRGNEIAGIAPF